MDTSVIISLSVKILGKRRPSIEKAPLPLPVGFPTNSSLAQFLEAVVQRQVQEFNQKTAENELLNYLHPDTLTEAAAYGKVTFGAGYNPQTAEVVKAVQTVLQAFEDGVFLVLVDGQQIANLHDTLHLGENTDVCFIRLVALSGGIF